MKTDSSPLNSLCTLQVQISQTHPGKLQIPQTPMGYLEGGMFKQNKIAHN